MFLKLKCRMGVFVWVDPKGDACKGKAEIAVAMLNSACPVGKFIEVAAPTGVEGLPESPLPGMLPHEH